MAGVAISIACPAKYEFAAVAYGDLAMTALWDCQETPVFGRRRRKNQLAGFM